MKTSGVISEKKKVEIQIFEEEKAGKDHLKNLSMSREP